jgi:hypothetical protein
VLALVIGGFGLAVLAIVASSLREAAAMKRWPTAEGRVLSAKVEEYRTSVSRGVGGSRARMTLYRPVLLYEYEVAGKRFQGSRVAQSPGHQSPQQAYCLHGSGAGTLSYQWEESPDLSSWSPIGGATGLTYSPGALTSTKHFRRAVESLLNGITCDAYSNIISITVTQVTASVWSNSPVCEGSLLALQATGGVSYSWSGPDGFSGTQQNPGISNVALSASGTYRYRH